MEEFKVPEIGFSKQCLSNGLEVILRQDNRVPLVHLSLYYNVGSSHERRGFSGLAHLFEHLMFQGSSNLDANEHGALIDRAGGEWNASTSKDRTHYYQTVPSHYLDLVLWLESDRMRALDISQENFENQLFTVLEEKKESYDNRPYGLAHLRFDEIAYGNWVYSHPIIGEEEDLKNCSRDDVLDFHKLHYGPGNAVLVLSGDFEPGHALERIDHYFGGIENFTKSFTPDLSDPGQDSSREETVTDNLAVLPALTLGYRMGDMSSDEYYDLTLLSVMLVDGDSSRLYRKYVYENNWITEMYAGPDQQVGPQIFRVWAQVHDGIDTGMVLEELKRDLAEIGEKGVTDEELSMARNQLIYRQVSMLSTSTAVGELLGFFQSCLGDASLINGHLKRYLDVTPRRIMESARKVFRGNNSTSITVIPGAQNE